MKTFYYFLEIILTVLIGSCGLTLLIGGICMNSGIPIFFGALAIIFCILALRSNEKNSKK